MTRAGAPMRVVQVANFYTPTSGGLRTALDQLGAGYLASGVDRAVVVPGASDRDEWTPHGRRLTVRSPQLPGSSAYRLFARPRALRRVVAGLRPDRIEVSDKIVLGWLAPWARERGIPVLLLSHERLDAILAPRVPEWFPIAAAADRVNRRLSGSADVVVATSEFSAAEWRRVGVPDVRLVPLGVALSVFRPPQAHPARPGVQLACVGRLSREKSPGVAIEVLRRLRAAGVPAGLLMVGDGPMRAELVRASAGLPVRFLGYLPDPRAVAHVLRHADVALAPSGAESFGLSILESLACGTPVVVPAEGAAAELVPAAGGSVAASGTPEALAGAVQQVLGMPAGARRAAARAGAERYPWSRSVAGMLAAHGLETVGSGRAVPRSA